MARRDNAPAKKKTNKSLPNNIDELVYKAKGKPREAWKQSVERLEKRIEKAEKETGYNFDIEGDLPKEISDYLLYGAMPRGRVSRKLIYEVEKIRIKDVKDIMNEGAKNFASQYINDNPIDIDTDFHVASKEIEELRENINSLSSPYFRNKFNDALDLAIAAYGEDNVAAHVAGKYESLKVDLSWAQKYELSDPDKAEKYYAEFNLILMNTPLSVEENRIATQSVEETAGVED